MTKNTKNKMPKNAEIYHCKNCDFKCIKESNFNTHLLTSKHKIRTNTNVTSIENAETYNCLCGKTYKHASSLWNHKQKCYSSYDNINVGGGGDTHSDTPDIASNPVIIEKMFVMFTQMMTQNQDFMTNVIGKVQGITNNTNNTNSHNTTNNQFNIQMFLNEHCKNAMNLTDFIDSLPITSETYDSTIENGLTKTITNLLVNGLSQLDILDRPIHCTDAVRKTLYVKNDNIWEKDNELLHILNGIKNLTMKQRTMLNKWQDANIGWDTKENLQSRMTKLVFNSMTSIENDDKETSKIIRAISKKVYLDNDTKGQYVQLE